MAGSATGHVDPAAVPEDVSEADRPAHRWHPHQLRRSSATRFRPEYGIEAAQVVLGHRNLRVTELYAEKNVAAAVTVMNAIG